MTINPVSANSRRLVINHSLKKSKTIVIGKTPNGSSFFRAIHRVNNQVEFGEMFLRKANGEERALFFKQIHGNYIHKKVTIEDSKNNKVTRSKTTEFFISDSEVKKVVSEGKNIGAKATLKERIYNANKMFIDKFIEGVEILPPTSKSTSIFEIARKTFKKFLGLR